MVVGLPVAREVYKKLSADVSFEYVVADGATLLPGRVIATVSGPARAILFGERVVLNFLQRLSGIATLTAKYVEKVKGHKARIYDTRKTTPGWRTLEKYAVKMGGGKNHRMGLYDQILIKDNHLKILEEGQVLTKTMEEVEEALAARPDIIMLDNMSVEDISRAMKIVKGAGLEKPPIIEVSGDVTLDNVEEIARMGPNWISVGALTHSAKALDIALDVKGRA